MFCMNCGQQLPDGARFCLQCGTPQGEVKPVAAPNPEPPKSVNEPTLVPAMCPNCGAHLRVDPSYKLARCGACGTECLVQNAIQTLNVSGSVNVVHSGVVIQKHDHSGEPNLIVTYSSTIPSINMSLNIIPGPQKVIFLNGATQQFTLAPGQYRLVASVGGFFEKINETVVRDVTISESHRPVTVSVSAKPGFIKSVYINVF